MAYGFITDGFTSAFNPNRPTLVINNIDVGVPVDGYSIIPNDSYIIQETGFGTLKTVWSHLSLSGDVTLYLKDIPEFGANMIDKLCSKQDTNYYISFLGYMYRTEQVDVTITPTEGSVDKLNVTLSFYGKLPYSTPIFRPGFSTAFSNSLATVSSYSSQAIETTTLLPLPGNSLRYKEDTVLVGVQSTGGTVFKIVTSVTETAPVTTAKFPLTANFGVSRTTCVGLLRVNDGEDEYVFGTNNRANTTVELRFLRIKDGVVTINSRASVALAEVNVSRISIVEGKLYCYYDSFGTYTLVTYDLMNANIASTRKVEQDGSKLYLLNNIPAEGQTPTPTPATDNTSFNMVLRNNKHKLLIAQSPASIKNAYDSYILYVSNLSQVPGLDITTWGIEHVEIIDENRLMVFFKNTKVGSSYLHYAILNFRDYDKERGNYYTAFVTGYKVSETNLVDLYQIYTYLGISQTNTAVIANNNCYMSTEAYTDFYKESNVLGITQTSLGFKYILTASGTTVTLKCMSK